MNKAHPRHYGIIAAMEYLGSIDSERFELWKGHTRNPANGSLVVEYQLIELALISKSISWADEFEGYFYEFEI